VLQERAAALLEKVRADEEKERLRKEAIAAGKVRRLSSCCLAAARTHLARRS
jgi:hypothetical protein